MNTRPLTLSILATAFGLVAPFVQGAAPPAAAPTAPTIEQVRNGAVRGVLQGRIVQLKDGLYEGPPFTRGGSERPRIELIEKFTATGNLDENPGEERVVLLRHDAGAAGVKVYLAVYGFKGPRVANLSTVLVGGDAHPTVLSIAGGMVMLDISEAGRQSRKVFRFGAEGLEPVPGA